MASWADKIPTFNPYVQQLPVEAMVKVGMAKQQQYEEGVQKIQTSIDNVAGLDVANDVDKKYLQSKLNSLGNNLKLVAAGDFSNFQLVNSVSGMAKQITKDQNVINAVSSTSWLRKQQAEMEKAISEGKSSQANQWDFGEKANRYLNSTKAGEKFNGRYTQYTDVNKKWLEVFKTLHPSITEEDMPYVKNNDGTINYGKTAAAMTEISKETVSEQQIADALRSSLTPDDLNQLSINGRYQFQSAGPEQLNQYSTKKYESAVKGYDGYIKHFEGLANMSNADPEVKKQALASIDYYKKAKENAKIELSEDLELSISNPDEAKSNIYKNGAIEEFAHAYSWESNKLKISENPILSAEYKEKNYRLDVAKYDLSVKAEKFNQWKDIKTLENSDRDYDLKLKELVLKTTGSQSGAVVYGGKATNIKDPLTAMNNDAVESDAAANSIISKYAKANNVNFDTAQKRFEAYRRGDKTAIDSRWQGEAQNWKKNTTESENILEAIALTKKEVYSSDEAKIANAKFKADVNALPALKYNINGKVYSFTKEELVEYTKKTKPITATYGLNITNKPLTLKEKILDSISKNDITAANNLNKYRVAVDNNYRNIKKLDDRVNEILLDRNGSYVPAVYNMNVTNKEGATSRDNMEGIAMNALLKFGTTLGGQKGGAETLSADKVNVARGWLAGEGKDDIQYKRLKQGKKQYIVMIKGAEEIVVPLTNEEIPFLPKNENEPSPVEADVISLQEKFNGTTNYKHIPHKGYFQPEDFTNVKNLNVTADLEWDESNHSLNYINYNIKLPSGWYYMQLEGYKMSADEAAKVIQGNTDNQIKQLFLNNPKVGSKIKKEILNLK